MGLSKKQNTIHGGVVMMQKKSHYAEHSGRTMQTPSLVRVDNGHKTTHGNCTQKMSHDVTTPKWLFLFTAKRVARTNKQRHENSGNLIKQNFGK